MRLLLQIIFTMSIMALKVNAQSNGNAIYKNDTTSLNDSTEFFTPPDRNGIRRLYHKNGATFMEGAFETKRIRLFLKGEVRHGLWFFYDTNGLLVKRGSYHEGEKDGLWEYFNHEGQLYLLELWNDGTIKDKRNYLDTDTLLYDMRYKRNFPPSD